MRWTVLAVLLLAACASSADPAATRPETTAGASPPPSSVTDVTTDVSSPDTPSSSGLVDQPVADDPSAGVRPEGFDSTLARVTLADGTVCELCVWLAGTAQQRSRGLMFVTDLGAAEAMAFRYPPPHTGTFWMKNTVLPLSIAFYAPDGDFLSSFDMEPCTSDRCPNYPTATGFEIAVEVPQGELAELGLVEGSRFELLDLPCDA